jgi:RNA polymerase sigma-70 factor (ECF subfamily)
LNQAIAIAQAGETGEALVQLQSLQSREDMQNYLLLDCAFARIYELAGNGQAAIDAYLRALSKTTAPHEKELLKRKLHRLSAT